MNTLTKSIVLLLAVLCALAVTPASAKHKTTKKAVKKHAPYVKPSGPSPHNSGTKDIEQWPLRKKTLGIVLHTTEAPTHPKKGQLWSPNKYFKRFQDQSSFNSLWRKGECNYLIETDGRIDTIIEEKRVGMHAGLSMWEKEEDLSYSYVGIEIVGTYSQEPTAAQTATIRKILPILMQTFHVDQTRVLSHSQVAYAKKNRAYPKIHRGRKLCGELFSTQPYRRKIGLSNSFTHDPDLDAGRVTMGPCELHNFIYGNGKSQVCPSISDEIANILHVIPKPAPKGPAIVKVTPKKFVKPAVKPAIKPTQPKSKPATMPTASVSDALVKAEFFTITRQKRARFLLGNMVHSITVLYIYPGWEKIKSGKDITDKEINELPIGTQFVRGFAYAGTVKKGVTAYKLVGKDWNSANVMYHTPDGEILTGEDFDDDVIDVGTIVIYAKK
jgi:hypothetical protein